MKIQPSPSQIPSLIEQGPSKAKLLETPQPAHSAQPEDRIRESQARIQALPEAQGTVSQFEFVDTPDPQAVSTPADQICPQPEPVAMGGDKLWEGTKNVALGIGLTEGAYKTISLVDLHKLSKTGTQALGAGLGLTSLKFGYDAVQSYQDGHTVRSVLQVTGAAASGLGSVQLLTKLPVFETGMMSLMGAGVVAGGLKFGHAAVQSYTEGKPFKAAAQAGGALWMYSYIADPLNSKAYTSAQKWSQGAVNTAMGIGFGFASYKLGDHAVSQAKDGNLGQAAVGASLSFASGAGAVKLLGKAFELPGVQNIGSKGLSIAGKYMAPAALATWGAKLAYDHFKGSSAHTDSAQVPVNAAQKPLPDTAETITPQEKTEPESFVETIKGMPVIDALVSGSAEIQDGFEQIAQGDDASGVMKLVSGHAEIVSTGATVATLAGVQAATPIGLAAAAAQIGIKVGRYGDESAKNHELLKDPQGRPETVGDRLTRHGLDTFETVQQKTGSESLGYVAGLGRMALELPLSGATAVVSAGYGVQAATRKFLRGE